jgi:2-methylcitrate dehydratase PrpD
VTALRYEALPADVVALAKALILDTLGTTIAALGGGEACRETCDVMHGLGGPPESTIVGRAGKVAAPHAAFANGALAHALNYDATGRETGHIGVACFAGTLALAEALGPVDGRRFVTAVVAAAEVTARISLAAHHSTGGISARLLSGQYLSYAGATAGCAVIAGLDARTLHSAFGLALMQTAGARQLVIGGDPPAKAIYGAFPAHSAVLAVRLAAAGVGAEIDAIDGEAGWLNLCGATGADPSSLLDAFGTTFACRDVEFKRWPVSNHVTPFIEAAIALHAVLAAREIVAIELTGPPAIRPWFEPLTERRAPSNAAAAANSIFFAVAKTLAHGEIGLRDFGTPGLRDATIAPFVQRMTYALDAGVRGGVVRLTLADGSVLTHAAGAPGSPSAVLSPAQLAAKFADCARAGGIADAGHIAALIAQIGAIEELTDAGVLASAANPETHACPLR